MALAIALRIYKHYDLRINNPMAKSHTSSFSGYPGVISSTDDFYILDSGMVVMETTNNVFNHSLYDGVKPQSALSWQRVRVANMLAGQWLAGGVVFFDLLLSVSGHSRQRVRVAYILERR